MNKTFPAPFVAIVGISSMGVMNPGLVMRNIIPVVMAGVLGIYGLIVAVIIQGSIVAPQNGMSQYSLYRVFISAQCLGHVRHFGLHWVSFYCSGQGEVCLIFECLILL